MQQINKYSGWIATGVLLMFVFASHAIAQDNFVQHPSCETTGKCFPVPEEVEKQDVSKPVKQVKSVDKQTQKESTCNE